MKLHAGNIVMIGFGVMILFMSYLVIRCTQNPSVMVTKDYYAEELKYQDLINAKTNAEAYSDSLTMNRETSQVSFHVPVAINQTLTQIQLKVYHKSNDKNDRSVSLPKNDQGIYTVSTTDWVSGNYELKLMLTSPAKNYYREFSY